MALVTLGQTVKSFDKSLVDIYNPTTGSSLFARYLISLNGWAYYQLNDAPVLVPSIPYTSVAAPTCWNASFGNVTVLMTSPNGKYSIISDASYHLQVIDNGGPTIDFDLHDAQSVNSAGWGANILIEFSDGSLDAPGSFVTYDGFCGAPTSGLWTYSGVAGKDPGVGTGPWEMRFYNDGTWALFDEDGMYWLIYSHNAGGTAIDSASPTQTTPTGHAWGEYTDPPPHNLTYTTNAQAIAGLLNDSRSAANNMSGSGAIASDTWVSGADAPMSGDGWWIIVHYDMASMIAQSGFVGTDQLFLIPVELGQSVYVGLQHRSDLNQDFVDLIATTYSSAALSAADFALPFSAVIGKHQIIMRCPAAIGSEITATLWFDGVNMGDVNTGPLPGGDAFEYLSQGFQVGGDVLTGDQLTTIQDVLIMPIGSDASGTDMSDSLATELYTNWSALL